MGSAMIGRTYYILSTCLENLPGVKKIVIRRVRMNLSWPRVEFEEALTEVNAILGIKRKAWSDVKPNTPFVDEERRRMWKAHESSWEARGGTLSKWDWTAFTGDFMNSKGSIDDGTDDESENDSSDDGSVGNLFGRIFAR